MTHEHPTEAHLDRELIVLLDYALGLQAGRFTADQRASLRARAGAMGLDEHAVRRCSAETQGVLLDEEPHVNREGGRVGDTSGEEPGEREGATVATGSARGSGTPTLSRAGRGGGPDPRGRPTPSAAPTACRATAPSPAS